jgi:hypothetical protein
MNAHFNFWYQQVFHNRTLDFQYFETSGIGAYAKVPGVLYSYTHDLYGFLEFVSEDVFRHLKEVLGHWSLFCYRDKELEWHYCVLFGTVALINHDTMSTGKLQVLNGEFDAEESIFQLDYYWSAGRIHMYFDFETSLASLPWMGSVNFCDFTTLAISSGLLPARIKTPVAPRIRETTS